MKRGREWVWLVVVVAAVAVTVAATRRDEPDATVSKWRVPLAIGGVTVGATLEDVQKRLGKPSYDTTSGGWTSWHFWSDELKGPGEVWFGSDGRVRGMEGKSLTVDRRTLDEKATRADIRAALGRPTIENARVWHYADADPLVWLYFDAGSDRLATVIVRAVQGP